MEQMRERTCCVFGHRDAPLSETALVAFRLAAEILKAFSAGCTRFITGMTTVTDLLFAENVLTAKESFPQIELVAAISHRGLLKSKDKYFQRFIKQCDQVVVLSEHYYPGVEGARTRWMLENSCRLIAVWDFKEHGPVFRTIDRAEKMGIKVQDIEQFVLYFPRKELLFPSAPPNFRKSI